MIYKKKVFINIVKSYIKFKTFITSGEKIDYSYLWDLISKKKMDYYILTELI